MVQFALCSGFEPTFDWPAEETFPRTDEEFHKAYEQFVARQVTRLNKVGRNLPDLLQEIWAKLVDTRFLQKFIHSVAQRYPQRMTAEEACDYLGVKFGTWKWYQRAFQKSPRPDSLWMPNPREGGRYSKDAIYSTEEVFMLEELRDLDQKKLKPVQARKRPRLNFYGFKSYLTKAIHNFFANWCRTHDRRYKESVVPANSVMSRLSTGLFRMRQSMVEDSSASWEEGLTGSSDMTLEDKLDLVWKMRRYNIDVESEEGARLMDLFSRGYTADQIFDKRLRLKKKTRLVQVA